MTLTVGSLFSGIGGFDLGLKRAGMQTLFVCEGNPFCQFVLAKRFPSAERFPDVRTLSSASVPAVDILCGGFPCQDISILGNSHGFNSGLDGSRSGLWTEFARLIRELRPSYVIIENSPQLRQKGLDRVLCDLAESGYDAEWDCLRAHDVGAPHLRERLFVVAYPCRIGFQGPGSESRLLDASSWKEWRRHVGTSDWWTVQPEPPRVADGFPGKLDKDFRRRVEATGNALVPQIAEWLGRRIIEDEAKYDGCRPSLAVDDALGRSVLRANQMH